MKKAFNGDKCFALIAKKDWAGLIQYDLIGADLGGADLRDVDLGGANLMRAYLSGANLDFSCLSLSCDSLKIHVAEDTRLVKQLAYHFCSIDCTDQEYITMRNDLVSFANGFHRVDECGKLEVNNEKRT